jgi:hypothetical protein
VQHYLAVHRAVLLAGESGQLAPGTDALWVSEVGTMLESGALARRVRKHTKEAFGASLRRTGSATQPPRRSGSRIHDTSAMPTTFLATRSQ